MFVLCCGDSLWFTSSFLERVSNDTKSSTKVITSTNHNRSKQRDEPIRIPSNNLQIAALKRGKIARTRCDWFWFYFLLVEKRARDFQCFLCYNVFTYDSEIKTKDGRR